MATYTYECGKCGAMMEVVQSMKDEPLTQCPECKEEALVRVITPAGGFRIYGRGVHKPTSRVQ